MPEQPEKFESWAIVEIMGHKKLAGYVGEQTIAGRERNDRGRRTGGGRR